MIYESHVAASFCYRWGRKDQKIVSHAKYKRYTGKYRKLKEGKKTALLLNPTNPIDKYIGDLFGRVDGLRFFLVEFKIDADGVGLEIDKKPARLNLIQHLISDVECNRLSWHGHFACYPHNGELIVEPYAGAADAGVAKVGLPFVPRPHGASAKCVEFNEFHDKVSCKVNVENTNFPGLFISGLGLTLDGIKKYLQCVLAYFSANGQQGVKASEMEASIFLGVVAVGAAPNFAWIPMSILTNPLIRQIEEQERVNNLENNKG